MARHVCSFLLQDLRRFAMFDSSATRPYTISAMSCWRRAHDIAYIALDSSGKVRNRICRCLGRTAQPLHCESERNVL